MNIPEVLGNKILNAYKRTIFPKVSKSEIDLLVFEALVIELFKEDKKIYINDDINWLKISYKQIRELSLMLMITESRVSVLIEQCALMRCKQKDSDDLIIQEMKYLLTNTRQNTKDIEEGILSLYIPNKFTRSAIESILIKYSGIPETSFNKCHLKIRLIDLLPILDNRSDYDVISLFEIAKKANNNYKDSDYTKIIEIAKEKTGFEKLKLISSAIIKPFLGKGGEYISEEIFDFLRNLGNK